MTQPERHPFEPFTPATARVLFLGTFPPQPHRRKMEFYYPNWINDFWRVMGLTFYGDAQRFCDTEHRQFRLDDIKEFLTARGIALYDTAEAVVRLRDNASDAFLKIVEPTDIDRLAKLMPQLRAIATTGTLAAEQVATATATSVPAIGRYEEITLNGRTLQHWRLPSTSRAYPLSLDRKAEAYARMLSCVGFEIAENYWFTDK